VRDSKAGTEPDNPASTDSQVVTWLRLLARFMPVIMEEGSDDFYQSLFWSSAQPPLLGERLMDVYVELLFLVRLTARAFVHTVPTLLLPCLCVLSYSQSMRPPLCLQRGRKRRPFPPA
jgi:hypothetical protein